MNNNNDLTQLKVWVPENLHRDFKITCTQIEKSMTQVIGEMINEFLKEKKGT